MPVYSIGRDYQISGDDDFNIVGANDTENAALTELFGNVETSSDESYEQVLGALEILGATQGGPARRAAASNLAQGQVVTRDSPKWVLSQILPCTSTNIATATSVDIELKPQRPFRPDFFRSSSYHSAPFFTVSAYAIGQENQFVAAGNIPLDLFSEVSLNSGTMGQTANPGTSITLTVNNISDATKSLRAAFFGKSLLPG